MTIVLCARRAATAGLLALAAACGGEQSDSVGEAPLAPEAVAASAQKTSGDRASLDVAVLAERIATLASDEFEGRAPATAGGAKTRAYLIDQMKQIGLEPANGDSYEQTVPLVEITAQPDASFLTIDGQTYDYGSETVYWTKKVADDVSFTDSPVVFVGYGVVAPEYGWNDYEGVDVEGKTVVMLVNDPGFGTEDPALFNGRAMTYYGRWTYKYEEAGRQGADAVLLIHQTEPAAYGWNVIQGWKGPQLDLERPDGGAGRVAMEAWIHESMARDLFAKAGVDFDAALEAAKSPDFTALPLGDLKASGAIKNAVRRSQSANVAGVMPGATAADEYVLYMAHWDHLGRNFSGVGDTISNGAVDNATGAAGILSIAEIFAGNETPPDRSLMFVAVTAEESGLLGSAYYAEDPLVPFNKTVGGINVDAILPTSPSRDVIVVGHGASELEDILEQGALNRGQYIRPDASPEKGYFYRSDHISLAKKGVPMLYADSGIDLLEGGEDAGRSFEDGYRTERYHQPSDEYSDNWDLSGMAATLELLYDVGAAMAYSDIWPNWREGNEFRALRDAQMRESEE